MYHVHSLQDVSPLDNGVGFVMCLRPLAWSCQEQAWKLFSHVPYLVIAERGSSIETIAIWFQDIQDKTV